MPSFKNGVRALQASQLLLRFLFGGAVCALASAVESRHGALVGGLFLAFPAAVPAMISIGLRQQGPRDALEIAYGSSAGALGLVGAGLFLWQFGAGMSPLTGLAIAFVLWFLIALAIWKLVFAGGPSDKADN